MKKRLLTSCAALFFAAITASAQMEKGTVLVGGNLSVGTYNYTYNGAESKTTSFGIAPSIGWAYSRNRFLGFSLSYAYSKQSADYKTNTFGAGAYMRQYFPVAKSLYLFAHEGLNFSTNKGSGILGTTLQVDRDTKGWSASLGVSPGLAYDLTKKIQLEVSLNNLLGVGYSHSTGTDIPQGGGAKIETQANNFSFNSNADPAQLTTLSVGVRFTLGRNKS